MPQHNHGISDSGHTHGYTTRSTWKSVNWWNWKSGSDGSNDYPHGYNKWFYGDNYASTGSSKTGITINNSGSSNPFDNRPAYYTLAFIMKL